MRPTDHPSRFENVRAILVSTPFIVALATLLANKRRLSHTYRGPVLTQKLDGEGMP